MSGLLDKAENMASNKLNQDSQPGDQVERSADSGVNNRTYTFLEVWTIFERHENKFANKRSSLELNEAANDVGVPQGDDATLDKVADSKVNSDIPFGNN